MVGARGCTPAAPHMRCGSRTTLPPTRTPTPAARLLRRRHPIAARPHVRRSPGTHGRCEPGRRRPWWRWVCGGGGGGLWCPSHTRTRTHARVRAGEGVAATPRERSGTHTHARTHTRERVVREVVGVGVCVWLATGVLCWCVVACFVGVCVLIDAQDCAPPLFLAATIGNNLDKHHHEYRVLQNVKLASLYNVFRMITKQKETVGCFA